MPTKNTSTNIISEADLRKQIKNEMPSGAYLLFGEEDYLKNYCADMIKKAVSYEPAYAIFNEISIDPMDLTPFDLETVLMSLPMGREKKIITIRGLSFSGMKPNTLDELIASISLIKELDHNVLVITVPPDEIDTGKLPSRPSTILKRLSECMTLVYFSEQTPSKLMAWAGRHFGHFGVSATQDICSRLINRCGKSMYILSSEIEKLSYYALSMGRNEVMASDIEAVTSAELDCDTFALTNAIVAGDRTAAMNVLEVLRFRRTEPSMIVGEVASTLYSMARVAAVSEHTGDAASIAAATGIHEYRVGMYLRALGDISHGKDRRQRIFDAIELCSDADARLKTQGAKDYEPVERMLCSI